MLFAIVDIETTGSYAIGNGITEIAIAIHDGEKIIDFYETLINPNRHIPIFIQSLTGITNKMVERAPNFSEVANHIYDMLQDKVFVAHNVNFDYSFIKHQLEHAGFQWQAKKLCTVRLSRKILPGLKSYSLGKLCHQLGIEHGNHHRAGGDVKATAALFTMLVEKDNNNNISSMLKLGSKEQYLPAHLPVEQIEQLPKTPGVYYFLNQQGKVIYVGKAINIFSRVKSHFSNNKANKQKQDFVREIHKISFKEAATELMAQIIESAEIRRIWPIYNRSQKGFLPKYGLYVYQDQKGFQRFAIEKQKSILQPLYTFNSLHDANQKLKALIHQFGLCPRLCNVISIHSCVPKAIEEGICEGHCQDPVTQYNLRTQQAIAYVQQQLPCFAIVDKGIDQKTISCILVDKGQVVALGFMPSNHKLEDAENIKTLLEPIQDNDFIRNLAFKFADEHPEHCVYFT